MSAPSELRIALSSHLLLTAQVWGAPDAPPLLALHGWLDNAGSYAMLAPLLAERWRVIALELPGHGHSSHLPAGINYHYVDYVSAVIAAADALQLERYTLLGHSLGAGIASLLAAAKPQSIERLYLIEGLGPLGDDGSHTLQRFRDAFAAPASAGKSLRVFRDIDQAVSARTLASGLRADLARPIVERGLTQTEGGYRWRSDPRLTRPSAVRLAESQIRALLAGIGAPTALLLSQPATPYLPSAMMQERANLLQSIAVTGLQGGHHLHLEHPRTVADWISASR
ncbi:alpha/beta fold hydrolase [Dyella mobilis]|uniref:Alpha/beta fold hydrolase n=1 Tax=Dyella mobilis TaxID=1849582 RepID=A0ABS2KCJ8_9GAMM|nr:alpha/beta hydrolase [Dyella mobilis]MBM7128593.1 alpha/beta fold hydrolase [Dyella mobilis]GLQ99503.1 alpha/beta hydrolase [Dyella mobilis]